MAMDSSSSHTYGDPWVGGSWVYPHNPQIYPQLPPQTFPGTDSQFHINTGRAVCMAVGHQATEVEWNENEAVAYCSQCGEKFCISKIPGGAIAMRVKFLLEILMTLEDAPAGVMATPTSNPLEELMSLTEDLANEVSALEETGKLLALARAILRKRYGPEISGTEPSALD